MKETNGRFDALIKFVPKDSIHEEVLDWKGLSLSRRIDGKASSIVGGTINADQEG